jgi:hypothetical protein
MHQERSTVLDMIELRKSTRAPVSLFHLGVKLCHPSFCILCRNEKLDRPLTAFEAKIGDWPHAADTIGDLNLSAGLLFWHKIQPNSLLWATYAA